MLSIAVSEAAEKHFRRAKDSSKLAEAVETKLTEQAKYVVWRDSVVEPSQERGKQKKRDGISERKSQKLPNGDPGALVAHRWRKKLCKELETDSKRITVIDDEALSAAILEALLRCQRACEMEAKGTERGTAGTGEFLRYTPKLYVEASRAVLGIIDLDPASDAQAQQTVDAEKFFTAEDDGLKHEWQGNVFLNPPYHRELLPDFVDKLIEELKAGRVKQAIMLTNNSTDTEWFRKAAEAANTVCFTNGRIAFTTPAGIEVAPTQGQAFFYFGPDVKKFVEVFRKIGFGMTTIWHYRASAGF